MREILFKAMQTDNREWVEGFYFCMVHDDGRHVHHFIMPIGADLSFGTPIEKIQVEIDVNTLCQYTGLTDKNGQKIWENDVVDLHGYGFGIGNIEIVSCKDGGFYPFMISKWECTPDSEDVEVIGNIFDNPELIHE